MPSVVANGITLEYESLGDESAPVMLLIMGLGMQLVSWPDPFCQLLVQRGFRVVRFDNRDCGLSTKLDGVVVNTTAVITAALMEEPIPEVPYTLTHMAADAMGVLDGLGIEQAHVMGASMGGMIAQTVAIKSGKSSLS